MPKERRKNPVQKTKPLGIAGLFSDESEAYVYNGSDSEASTSGAAPASVIESEDEDIPHGNILRMNVRSRMRFVLQRGSFPKRGMMKFLRCLVLIITRVNLIALKLPYLISTAGLL